MKNILKKIIYIPLIFPSNPVFATTVYSGCFGGPSAFYSSYHFLGFGFLIINLIMIASLIRYIIDISPENSNFKTILINIKKKKILIIYAISLIICNIFIIQYCNFMKEKQTLEFTKKWNSSK